MGYFSISRINKDLSIEEIINYEPANSTDTYDDFEKNIDKAMNDIFGGNGSEVYYEYYYIDDLSPFN